MAWKKEEARIRKEMKLAETPQMAALRREKESQNVTEKADLQKIIMSF